MYLVNIEDDYILGVVSGVSHENSNINEDEYLKIKSLLENAPDAPEDYTYKLTKSLEWELCELPPVDVDKELSAEESLAIITGGEI